MNRSITIPCSKAKLESIREFVSDILKNLGISEVETHKIILAIDEVCANLIIHSNNCNPDESLQVAVEHKPEEFITFIIKDSGLTFDITQYDEPTINEVVQSKRKGGIGLMLVKRIMDKIEFSTENNYNICKLTKRL